MNNGTVKFYNELKGFGFIKDSDSSKEYYVAAGSFKGSIKENDVVTFDIVDGKKGQNAVNVKIAH